MNIWDLLILLLKLLWSIVCAGFSLLKTLTGVRNDIVAAALGITPFLAAILVFVFRKVKKLIANN